MFEHLVSSGLKPNAQTYAILLQAHVVNKDPSAALSIISSMVTLHMFYLNFFLCHVI